MRSAEGLRKRREQDRLKKSRLRASENKEQRSERLAYHKAKYRQDRQERLEYMRSKRLRRFGLSVSDYEAIHRAQGGVCAICRKAQRTKRLAVDHDHATGRVRGLLCSRCNTGIGLFWDDPALLYASAAYLGK